MAEGEIEGGVDGKVVEPERVSDNNRGPVEEKTKRAPGILSAEDFIREVQERGDDGYFVSSKWLLSMEEHERESLMAVLGRAGYSAISRTTTTTLFERTGNLQTRSPKVGSQLHPY